MLVGYLDALHLTYIEGQRASGYEERAVRWAREPAVHHAHPHLRLWNSNE